MNQAMMERLVEVTPDLVHRIEFTRKSCRSTHEPQGKLSNIPTVNLAVLTSQRLLISQIPNRFAPRMVVLQTSAIIDKFV